jgi:hypothetical protein
MSSRDLVKCQCCGKMMVPTTIFSRGLYGGWGWRIGGGRPVSNCCPFCLSENWEDGKVNLRNTTGFRLLALVLSFLFILTGVAILKFANERYFGGHMPNIFGLIPILGGFVFGWWFSKI